MVRMNLGSTQAKVLAHCAVGRKSAANGEVCF